MARFGKSPKRVEDENAHQAMLIGTKLEFVPMVARARALKIAASRGWTMATWPTRKACRVLAIACWDAKERMISEGLTSPLNELGQVMFQLFAYLGIKLADMKRENVELEPLWLVDA